MQFCQQHAKLQFVHHDAGQEQAARRRRSCSGGDVGVRPARFHLPKFGHDVSVEQEHSREVRGTRQFSQDRNLERDVLNAERQAELVDDAGLGAGQALVILDA